MYLRALTIGLILTGLTFAGCSSKSTKGDSEQVEQNEPQEKGPECLQGCMLDSEGDCNAQANAMDWSGAESSEVIECDPRCCRGAKTVDGSSDPDGDGLYDDADQCPAEAEDLDGFQDEDGCPDDDNDGDGIPDSDDLCPLDAEDFDGYQDDDGCIDP